MVKIKVPFVENEYYHIYNRGVDKRIIFNDSSDILRFYQSMQEFNSVEPIGSLFKNRFNKLRGPTPQSGKLVEIVAYCLNPNHYHLILTPLVEGGISEFMKRLGGGYTTYFNTKHKRSGVLFQGGFKSVYVDSDSYLRFLSVYVNLNFEVHKKFQQNKNNDPKKLFHKSSWEEYLKVDLGKDKKEKNHKVANSFRSICEKKMILSHFDSVKEYENFAKETLVQIKKKRYGDEDILKKDFSISEEL